MGEILLGIAVLITTITTAVFNYRVANRTRLTESAALLNTMIQSYDSPEMKNKRAWFAYALYHERDEIDLYQYAGPMDFFEEVGYLVMKDVLDADMVRNHFFWPFERFYLSVTDKDDNLLRKARLEHDYTELYKETERLFEALKNKREQATGYRYRRPDQVEIRQFLYEEYISNRKPPPGPNLTQ